MTVDPALEGGDGADLLVGAEQDVGLAEVDAVDQQAAQIADCLMRVMRAQHAVRAKVVASDNDAATTFLLLDLIKHGPRRASDLAGQHCADPSTVSRQVASLVKAGLLERTADPDDGRASILVPTAAGISAARQRVTRRGRAVRPVVQNWSEAERTQFLSLLRRFLQDFESHRDTIIAGYRTALSHIGSAESPAESNPEFHPSESKSR